jgi:hypothetical protein
VGVFDHDGLLLLDSAALDRPVDRKCVPTHARANGAAEGRFPLGIRQVSNLGRAGVVDQIGEQAVKALPAQLVADDVEDRLRVERLTASPPR